MMTASQVEIGLRPASPQPSKRHGRDPLTFTWCKLETLAATATATATAEEDDPVSDSDNSDPIVNVTDSSSPSSSSSSGNANAKAAFKSTAIATSHQSDWYRFPAPTQVDAKRSTPYIDNVTRLEARLLGKDEDKAPAASSTKWDFKMVGQWRVGELLGKGTSGAYRRRHRSGRNLHQLRGVFGLRVCFVLAQAKSDWSEASRAASLLPSNGSFTSPTTTRYLYTSFRELAMSPNQSDDSVSAPSQHAHSIHREVCIMKLAANHPHLLQLYDIYETPEH